MEEGEAEPGEMPSLKRPNPITWQTPPKKQRVADASDESPADSADIGQEGRQAGGASASRAASSKQPQPSPAKGEPACFWAWHFSPGKNNISRAGPFHCNQLDWAQSLWAVWAAVPPWYLVHHAKGDTVPQNYWQQIGHDRGIEARYGVYEHFG